MTQPRFAWDTTPDAARFWTYHTENPAVYEALRRFALEAKRAGRARLGINALHERARWETQVVTSGDDFKLNNSYRPFYARLLMEREPELAGFFELRHARADEETEP